MVEEFELIKSEFKNEISELKKETNQKLHDHLNKLRDETKARIIDELKSSSQIYKDTVK